MNTEKILDANASIEEVDVNSNINIESSEDDNNLSLDYIDEDGNLSLEEPSDFDEDQKALLKKVLNDDVQE